MKPLSSLRIQPIKYYLSTIYNGMKQSDNYLNKANEIASPPQWLDNFLWFRVGVRNDGQD